MSEARREFLRIIITRARDALKLARQCLETESFQFASIHAYTAAFHGMKALLELENVAVSKHGRVIGEINRLFIKTGRFEKETSRVIDRLFRHRQIGSYDYDREISAEEAKLDVEDAARLLREFENVLRQQTQDEFFRAPDAE